MSKCQEMESQLNLLLAGEVSTADRRRIEKHLAGCAGCRGEMATLAEGFELLRGLRDVDQDIELGPERWANLRDDSRAVRPRRSVAGPVAAVVVFAVAGIAGFDLGNRPDPPAAPGVSTFDIEWLIRGMR